MARAIHVPGLDKPVAPQALRPPKAKNTVERLGSISVNVGQAFEQALELNWQADPADAFEEFSVEMVLDHGDTRRSGKLEPAKDALVQQVPADKDTRMCVQNMPTGRKFLVTVVGRLRNGSHVRSPWARAATLAEKSGSEQLNLDPNEQPRLQCHLCSCASYVSFPASAANALQARCRRCGCACWDHVLVQSEKILRAREARACSRLDRGHVRELPNEALGWDGRECDLWFCTDGAFHPRAALRGSDRPEGGQTPGLVSVVTPTTEGRQHFHLWLWSCFNAQSWPDKELVVVETYYDEPSDFLEQMSSADDRLVYYKIKMKPGEDLTIGTKRNIGAHLAKGEFIASFDDDDLYAPEYLTTMVSSLEERKGQAIKLSSWYIFKTATHTWEFCDPIAWGMCRGVDVTDPQVRKFTYGYGFSYVYRRQVALDIPYEDINFGEDFLFIAKVLADRGDASVLLLRDDVGMCLHIQHGTNTSSSVPLRRVPREETLDLAVMELSSHVARIGLTQIDSHPAGASFAMRDPSKPERKVRVYLPEDRELDVNCPADATTEAFLRELWQQHGEVLPWKVLRVPPPEVAEDEGRDRVAALVLGIAFLAELPDAWLNLLPETDSGQQWRRLLEEAKRPLRPSDRLGLRTRRVWLVPSEDVPEAAAEELASSEEYVLIDATVQKSNVKQFFSTCSSFKVWLPKGSTVESMRAVLAGNLPPKARILIERPGKGCAVLQNGEEVPSRIIVTEFKGTRTFYMYLTRNKAKVCLLIMRRIFPKPSVQRQLDEYEREAKGNVAAFRGLLGKLLRTELYPEICRQVGLPENTLVPPMLSEGLAPHIQADLEMAHLWLETDWWVRNYEAVGSAFGTINYHRMQLGLQPYTDIRQVDPTRKSRVQDWQGAMAEAEEAAGAAAAAAAAAATGPADEGGPPAAAAPAAAAPAAAPAAGAAAAEGGSAAGGPAAAAEPESPKGIDELFSFGDLPDDM